MLNSVDLEILFDTDMKMEKEQKKQKKSLQIFKSRHQPSANQQLVTFQFPDNFKKLIVHLKLKMRSSLVNLPDWAKNSVTEKVFEAGYGRVYMGTATGEGADLMRYYVELIISLTPVFMVAIFAYPPLIMWMNKQNWPKTSKYDSAYNLWNFILAIFSVWGASTCVPDVCATIYNKGILETILDPASNFGMATPIYWFCLSKIWELGDTIFVIIRGRKLIFLQYYHHWITLVYCYHSFCATVMYNGGGSIFTTMNFFVHAMMYSFYFASGMGVRLSGGLKNLLTFLQFFQMVIAVATIVVGCRNSRWLEEDPFTVYFLSFMYGSYVWLFGDLFFGKVKIGNVKMASKKKV